MRLVFAMILAIVLMVLPCYAESKKENHADVVAKRVQKLLEKEKCTLKAGMVLSEDGIEPFIRIVPLPDKKEKKPKK